MAGSGRIREGMQVIGRDGEYIGRVKQVRGSDFLVDRPMRRDVFVPYSAVKNSGGEIELRVASFEVDVQRWPRPQLRDEMERVRNWRQKS